MKAEIQTLKEALDELLNAHNEFDGAMYHCDHDGMMKAQKRVEEARVKCALASRNFEKMKDDLDKLDGML